MVVRRGFPHPPSYQTERLREAPIEHFYDVITNSMAYVSLHGASAAAGPLGDRRLYPGLAGQPDGEPDRRAARNETDRAMTRIRPATVSLVLLLVAFAIGTVFYIVALFHVSPSFFASGSPLICSGSGCRCAA